MTASSPSSAKSTSYRFLRSRGAARPWEICFWIAVCVSVPLFPDHHLLLTEIAILGLFAMSLDILIGYCGVATLGHGAFFGLGAYAAGLVSIHVTPEPFTGLIVAGVASGLLGVVFAPLMMLKSNDLTRMMVSLGVAMLIYEAANKAVFLTGGMDGLPGVSIAPILGRFEFDLFGTTGYIYTLAVTFAAFLATRMVLRSNFGMSLQAIKQNERRAVAIGVPVRSRLWVAFGYSAVVAGLAGGLLTQTTMFVSLDVLAFHRSTDVLLILVLGGVGYLYGGFFGAIIFKLLQDWISVITPQYWMFWVGLIMLVIILIGRDRLQAWPRRILTVFTKRGSA